MSPRPRPHYLAAFALMAACTPRDGEPSGFGTTPGIASVPSGTTDHTTGSGTSGSASTAASSTSTSDDSGSAASAGTTHLDLGGVPDVGDPQPLGCQGKIDFLFVISRQSFMAVEHEFYGTIHDRLVAAIPQFFDTIETKFSDFDYHILVTKGDPWWGSMTCDAECPGPFAEGCPTGADYPCEMVGNVSACDQTWGAGVVFNAGWNAANKPCEIAGGKRYLTKDQPDPAETFACMAQVGASGSGRLGQALTAAVSPSINGPGGCNDGFLRDDALLVVTLVASNEDPNSEGTPYSWVKAVSAAKGDDRDAIVMLYIGPPTSLEWCLAPPYYAHLCEMFNEFPQRVAEFSGSDNFGPAFETATDMVVEACASFIPIPK